MEGRQKHINLVLPLLFFYCFNSSFLIVRSQGCHNGSQIQTYIVHLHQPGNTKFLRDVERESWHTSFLPNTTLHSGEPRLVYSYREAINGFAARLTPDEAEAMAARDGFLHAQLDEQLSLATTHSPAFLGLRQWDEGGLWTNSSFGKGAIIGVIDSGIDPNHPSFSENGVMPPPPAKWKGRCAFRHCNNKLIGAMAFHGGCRPSPNDRKDGHGTHVAGIAAGGFVDDAEVRGQAKGRASGMAPKAHLAVYKVCFKNGCHASDILAGIDQAISDGVDVLSISIARHRILPLYTDTIAIGSLAAVKKGIFTSLPAGNSGPYRSVILNDAPWVLTVGATSMDRRVEAVVRLGNGVELVGESGYQPKSFKSYMLPIVFPGYKGQEGRPGCRNGSFSGVDLKGKIVLCSAGGVSSNKKAGKFVKRAGGVAMIVLNPFYSGTTTLSETHVLPVAHVGYSDALKIISYLTANSTPTAAILFRGTHFAARPSPAVAAFSSRGPSLVNGGILKPDITGPGVNILSAWPAKARSTPIGSSAPRFSFQSGTSIATPHLSGVAALLKSNHPDWSPAAIKSAIMTTADRLDLEGVPIADEYHGTADIFAIGSGQVNPIAANDPGLIYDLQPVEYIRYLCGLGFTDKQVSMIARRQVECYDVAKTSAEELNYPSISVQLRPKARKTIPRQVTNVGEANEAYLVKVEEPEGVRVVVSPYKLQFSKFNQKIRFRVELSIKDATRSKGEVSEGQLLWISNKHVVRSPIAVTFA